MAGPDLETALSAGLLEMGLDGGEEFVGRLARFLRLLERWNEAFNLTSIRQPGDMVVRHVLDSLSVAPFLRGETVLDVGTGAGFPGIPLALLGGDRHFTLLDSGGKKIRFVRQVVSELALANVTVAQARVESFRPPARFDTVVCRALTSLARFACQCGRLVASGGVLLAMKGRYPHAEVAELPAPWQPPAVTPVTVPGLDACRHVVAMERH